MFKKVVVAISGGVDSAVASVILKKKGFNLVACFMKNWDIIDEIGNCTEEKDFADAQWVCNKLNIPLVQVNFVKEYWNDVFSYTLDSYANGETPNPDILCNRNIKFDKFYDFAMNELKADAIATGHYARTSFGPFLEDYKEDENVKLLQAKDPRKDQTFFLCQVPQCSLKKCMFPLGNYIKSDIKRIALHNDLKPIVDKRESMGMCFIGKRKFKDFISEYIENKPGDFIDVTTHAIVGKHKGQHMWTLGQCIKSNPISYYIFKKDLNSNNIFVVPGTNHSALYSDLVITSRPHWINEEPEQLQKYNIFSCYFRFQHLKPCIECKIYKTFSNKLIILFEKPLRAVTAGQYAVFYLNNECLGSAKIVKTGPSEFFLKSLDEKYENVEEYKITKSIL